MPYGWISTAKEDYISLQSQMQNEISERKNLKDKRNILKNDIYHRKQIDEKKIISNIFSYKILI